MTVNLITMSLSNLAAGKASARFDDEPGKVLENIVDPNTAPKAPRVITLRVVLRPDEERRNLEVDIAVTSKVAPTKTVKTFARCGIGPEGVVAVEDTSRNGDLFPPEQRDPKKVLDMPVAPANGKE